MLITNANDFCHRRVPSQKELLRSMFPVILKTPKVYTASNKEPLLSRHFTNATLCKAHIQKYFRVQNASIPDISASVCRRQMHNSLGLVLLAGFLLPKADAMTTLDQTDVTPTVDFSQVLSDREKAVVGIYERNSAAVVNIFDITLQARSGLTPQVEVPEGNGTGIVWDRSGHIVTCWHVLAGILGGPNAAATQSRALKVARVTITPTGSAPVTYDAVLVGADKVRDLAVLKVEAAPELLQPVTLGASDGARVGQFVLALGNPFGFDHSLTTGVISGLNREIRSAGGAILPGCIQTDAVINPGNSGGPLFDARGDVVGITTAIFTPTGSNAGLGFAIPISSAALVVDQLIRFGRVVRATLGIQVATPTVARQLGVAPGALIAGVVPGGAGAKAGLLPTRRGLSGIIAGDVITAVGRVSVKDEGDLLNALDRWSPGQEVELSIVRAGEKGPENITIKATLDAEK